MLTLPYIIRHNYVPDFILPNGIVIEAKGYFDQEARRKMAAVKEAHPDIDIRFVFQRAATKLGRGSPTSYAEWAVKHGFKWANAFVPTDWINEPANPVSLAAIAPLRKK